MSSVTVVGTFCARAAPESESIRKARDVGKQRKRFEEDDGSEEFAREWEANKKYYDQKIKEHGETHYPETKYFVENKHDLDAILEYAKQKGYVATCDEHGEPETLHFHDSVDNIVDKAVKEGMFEFYENNGTCYRLTEKGVRSFEH